MARGRVWLLYKRVRPLNAGAQGIAFLGDGSKNAIHYPLLGPGIAVTNPMRPMPMANGTSILQFEQVEQGNPPFTPPQMLLQPLVNAGVTNPANQTTPLYEEPSLGEGVINQFGAYG